MSHTLESIAKELGLSKTTVSRAISGKGRISEETRKKVNEYIKQALWHAPLQPTAPLT